MRNIITLVIFGLLILSGIGASAILEKIEPEYEQKKYSDFILFSEPIIKVNEDEYLFIDLKEANANLKNIGEPILPIVMKKFTFPFGTKIKDIQVTFSGIKQYSLSKKIAPAPIPVTTVDGVEAMIEKENKAVYNSIKQYPEEQYDFSFHAGLEEKDHVIILNLQCFPIHYLPVENLLYSAGSLKIDVTYEPPKKPVIFPDEYDMVIIAPEKFSTELQPLIEHKDSFGIQTILKTTESIYDEYSGRDQPEQIKYFIKDAIENWNVSYVLLVGGKKSLLFGNWGVEGPRMPNDDLWHVPVRYNNLLDSTGEAGCLTDLYFSDIYKFERNDYVFDDWDSDENNVFAEWTLDNKDILDLYPDVYVGRLACRNRFEVRIMVNKIITYEAEGCDPSWFNKIVGVGGDSFDDAPPLGDDYFEGEERNKLAFDYLSGFTPVKIWASHQGTGKPVPSKFHILRALNDGCGFVYFAGHGSTALYRTYWYHDWNHENATQPFNIYDMLRLRNGDKLPICMVGACHNSEFNVSFFNYLESPLEWYPTPECWSWMLTRKIGGGAIATIGYTGLEWVATFGWDTDDIPDCTQYFSGYIDSRFFHAYGVDGVEILGEACGQAITEYLDSFPGMDGKWDCKTVQQWHLLGDPSLKIGGYT
jgi:hypothetical protein